MTFSTLALISAVSIPSTSDASTPPAGCVSETGTAGACVDGTALDGATGVTISPDGTTVYVASETSRAVSVFSRDASTGAISQLAGTDGCVSDSGTGGACADGTALVGPRSLAVSPDGANLYFPATTSAAVAVFSRDPTGRLAQLSGTAGCVSETGTGGACADGVALEGARSADVSPDGTSVYVASYFSDAAAVFARETTTGLLTQATSPCVSETGTSGACADGVALDGARTVVVSPEGRNVYVASETSGAVAVFSRDGSTGVLTQLSGLSGCVSQTGTDGACTDVRALAGAGGVAVSPDGQNVYVASLSSDAVAVFSRDQTTGALTQLVATAGCVSETGNGGSCTDGRGLDRPRSVAISGDGQNVYVAAETGDAVAVFARDQATGRLTQLPGTAGCVSETGSAGECADGTALDGARSVAVSPDGKSVYAASFYSSAVSVFARDETTGALTQLGQSSSTNAAPVVSAGANQTITLPAGAVLDGTVSDDGLPSPPGTVTTTWTQTSGPGTVVFGDTSAVDTSAAFSAAGVYVLRLTASDGDLASSAELTVTVNPAPGGDFPFYLSLLDTATVGGISADNEDVLLFDGQGIFSLAFDGSDVGLATFRIDAFSWLDQDSLLVSFDAPGAVPGITGTVDDSDLVRFDATSLGPTTDGTFSLYFDGSDVGLTTSGEDVDALELLPDGDLLLSTLNTASGTGGGGEDEDLLRFLASSLGTNTVGTFSLYFDGSDVALTASGEDVDGAAVAADGRIHLSTYGNFAVSGASGADEDVFVFTPTSTGDTTSGSFASTLHFDGSVHGLAANDVLDIDLP